MVRTLFFISLLCGVAVTGIAAGEKEACPDNSANTATVPLFTFGVVSDVHYSNRKETKSSRHYAASGEKIREAVATFDAANVDFVVSLGDMIDGDVASYADIRPILENAAAPVYGIAGNHDYLGPYGSDVQRHVFEELGIAEPYFCLAKAGFRLLFLDSNDISTYARAKGSPEYEEATRILGRLKEAGAANARSYNGAIGEVQRKWLAGQLDDAARKGERVICLAHMPLMPLEGQFTLWNNARIAGLLQGYPCVKAFLAGHHHKGGSHDFGHIRHFTFQGMIENDDNHYAIVEVYADRLVIRGLGAQQGATLTYL